MRTILIFGAIVVTRLGFQHAGFDLAQRAGVLLSVCAKCRRTYNRRYNLGGGLSHGLCQTHFAEALAIVRAGR